MSVNTCLIGDCCASMRQMIAAGTRVHMCVTSPPYWGLRDYQVDGQIGLEQTPEQYVARMVEVFGLVRQLLHDDGVLWLNLGDSYAAHGAGADGKELKWQGDTILSRASRKAPPGLKPKDLVGIPWRVAFALQAAGWWLRQDIIWCLSGGAWVYARTQKGDMPVMVKDLVRLDPATVKLWNGEKWTQVLGWGPSNDESERLELVLRSGERIGCTGGHQWPTQRGNVMARELRVGDTIQSCRLPEPQDCERPAFLTDDALWLAGLYMAEGNRNGSAAQLSLCSDEVAWLPRIAAIAKHYGGTCTHTIAGGCLTVRLYGRVLRSVIDAYIGGETAINKHMKNAVWRLPNDALRIIVQGYLDGDGHHNEGNGRWRLGFCRNYSLERDLRTAAARLGATLTLNPVNTAYQGGESPAFRGEWRWDRSGHWNEKDRSEIVEIRASRARGFWDVAVEDDPHLFALASGVLTHNCKPSPMPESVTDRCTKAHEYLFLLTKNARYFYDAEAVKEGGAGRLDLGRMTRPTVRLREGGEWANDNGFRTTPTRNRRSVWTIATVSYKGSHFAVFPPMLVKPCIMAGTSERGHCPKCGAGWRRVLTKTRTATRPGADSKVTGDTLVDGNRDPLRHVSTSATTGWEPGCRCGLEPVPAVVFDPFMGSGTTAGVAEALGRNWLGCELSAEYAALQPDRIATVKAKLTGRKPVPRQPRAEALLF